MSPISTTGTRAPEEYWKLYDYAVAGVRSALPESKVWADRLRRAPGSAKACAVFEEFSRACELAVRARRTGAAVPIDFISLPCKGISRQFDGGQGDDGDQPRAERM